MNNYINLAGYQVDAEVLAEVDAAAQANGVPRNVVRAIGLAESGLNPNPPGYNDAGLSSGLLQLYRNGGQGDGYTHEQLLDVGLNLKVGMVAIRAAWQQTAALGGAERVRRVAGLSGHPRDPYALERGHLRNEVEASIERIVSIWRTLEGEQPEPAAAQWAGIVPVVDGERINEVIERTTTWVREHPREAAIAAGTILATVLLV